MIRVRIRQKTFRAEAGRLGYAEITAEDLKLAKDAYQDVMVLFDGNHRKTRVFAPVLEVVPAE